MHRGSFTITTSTHPIFPLHFLSQSQARTQPNMMPSAGGSNRRYIVVLVLFSAAFSIFFVSMFRNARVGTRAPDYMRQAPLQQQQQQSSKGEFTNSHLYSTSGYAIAPKLGNETAKYAPLRLRIPTVFNSLLQSRARPCFVAPLPYSFLALPGKSHRRGKPGSAFLCSSLPATVSMVSLPLRVSLKTP